MEENQVSITAMGTACVRAYHSRYVTPKIFDDCLASDLLTEEEFNSWKRQLPELLPAFYPERAASCPDQETALAWVMRDIMNPSISLSRARYTEDSLETAMTWGVEQYVILGAGLDTFAFRRPEMVRRLQVFEVDHPATQAFKRERIADLGWEQPPHLHFVPLDFTRDDLDASLRHSGYDPRK